MCRARRMNSNSFRDVVAPGRPPDRLPCWRSSYLHPAYLTERRQGLHPPGGCLIRRMTARHGDDESRDSDFKKRGEPKS